ncbi:MAG: 50S ribosomal protein L13 [Candidatus Shikimatogenerans bostrichidophilus]|nr:MAG: 50S ribosomal protein L13 [Candidatus Shikimatogenerans bostrichidophilus]
MDSLSLKTKFFKKKNKNYFLIDAKNQILGRLCSKISKFIIGKNLPIYTPNYSFINKIIIINAKLIKINKKKIKKKKYYIYSGYIGNKKEYTMEFLFKKNPCIIIKKCIERMLPKNLLGKLAKKNIYIFKDNKHNIKQKIKILNINNF